MTRREFITLLGGAAVAWPVVARAQQAGKLPTIGYSGGGTPLTESQRVAAFVQRLRELGWAEGRNVAIEYRWSEGRNDRVAEIAVELVRIKVDVIVTTGTPAALAAKQATSVIPVVITGVADPVGSGLVASQQADLAGKRLELLREVIPALRRLAILANVGNPNAVPEMGEVRAAARTLGLEVALFEIRRTEDIAPAFEALIKDRSEALYVVGDSLLTTNRIRLNTLALGARLPTSYANRESVEVGGLMSYGPNFLTCSGAPQNMRTKSCEGQNQPIFRSSSRTSSISSSTWSRRRRSASPCPRPCSPAPTR
jgi:putative tryptophan/tyrosine transport system substrate-binding protein